MTSGARPSFGPAFLAVLLLLCPPSYLLAISVVDVIRMTKEGYPDEEIIRLIRVTDSRFALSAKDGVRLRNEGLAEEVIREMLARPAGEEPAPEGPERTHEHETQKPRPRVTIQGSEDNVRIERRSEPLFSASTYEEAGAGHHVHAALTLTDLEVVILRDEASFASPFARAQSLAGKLNGLADDGQGRFRARGLKVAFESPETPSTDILAVTPGDVAAYRARSRQRISAETLASFWSALLNDYWLIAVAGKPPRYLIDFPEGEHLEELYRALDPETRLPKAEAIRAAIASLRRSDEEHLRRLPTAVPENLDFPRRRSR